MTKHEKELESYRLAMKFIAAMPESMKAQQIKECGGQTEEDAFISFLEEKASLMQERYGPLMD